MSAPHRLMVEAGNEPQAGPASSIGAATSTGRCIGEIIGEVRGLSARQIEQVLVHQRAQGLRFGEAAVALGLADRGDVVDALARQFGYPVVAPQGAHSIGDEVVVATDPFSAKSEAFRDLRSQLLAGVFADRHSRALAVLSPDTEEGKTFVAANTAAAFSQLGRRTLLIDADMRTPRQHQIFGIQNPPGLSTVLAGRSDYSVIKPIGGLPNLYLLAAGPVPPNPVELLERQTFGVLIDEMLERFDHVVIDTPAGSYGADARIIAAKAGAALVVGRTGRSRVAALQAMLEALDNASAHLAGVVMNSY